MKCMDRFGMALYESMHSLGNITVQSDIIKILEQTASDNFRTDSDNHYDIIFVNFDDKSRKLIESVCKHTMNFIDSSVLKDYIPTDSTQDWIASLHVSCIIFNDTMQDSAVYDLLGKLPFVQGQCEIGNYTYDKHGKIGADLNLYCCKFIDGKIKPLDDCVTLQESIYHELMHMYKYYNLHKNTGKSESNSSEYEKLLWYADCDIFANQEIVDGIHSLAYTLYALSDDEMPAYIGMAHEHFNGAEFKTRMDLIDEILSSVYGEIIRNADKAREFLNICNDPVILHKHCTVLSGETPYTSVWDIVEDILKCGFTKKCSGDVFQKIDKATVQITERINLFKTKLYNVIFSVIKK